MQKEEIEDCGCRVTRERERDVDCSEGKGRQAR